MASYLGCRPIFMFDTRIKLEDKDDADQHVGRRKVAGNREDYGDDSRDSNISDDTDWDDAHTTLVDSDTDLDHDGDASTCSDGDDDTDSDSGIDDDVDAGLDETGSLLWRHIAFIIAPNKVPGQLNVLFAKVTIVHTKGEDNCPREWALAWYLYPLDTLADLSSNRKTFIVEREDNPLLCLLDRLLSLTLKDDVFAAKSLRDVCNIFQAQIPSGRKSLQLKIKASALDIPEPGRAADGFRLSPTKPLRSGTWLRYLQGLGRKSELKKFFIQYCARRGLINAVNSELILLQWQFTFSSSFNTNLWNSHRSDICIDSRSDLRSPVEYSSILPRSGDPIQYHCRLLRPSFRWCCSKAGQTHDVDRRSQRFDQVVPWAVEEGGQRQARASAQSRE